MYSAKKEVDQKVATKIPEPTGYKLLIQPLEVKAGPDAYGDKDKFPNGPYCKEGDFVIFRSYSGTRFKIEKQEFRLINDDTVEAVVEDPRGYTRA
jgi:hypothetical protein